jgi:hypothetical protein
MDRRTQVTTDLIAAAEHSAIFGASRLDIEKSKVHSYFAASLYYLKSGDKARFLENIESAETISSSIGWRFDERQEKLFNRRFAFTDLVTDVKSKKILV